MRGTLPIKSAYWGLTEATRAMVACLASDCVADVLGQQGMGRKLVLGPENPEWPAKQRSVLLPSR